MKHFQSMSVSILVIAMIVVLAALGSKVNESPTRNAYLINNENGKTNAVPIRVRKIAVLSDTKLINFAERVAITCFSLTPLNYETKSNYCAEQFFSANPAAVYKKRYAEIRGRQISDEEATTYATVVRKPIITASWEKTNFQYYTVVIPIITTRILRDKRLPELKLAQLWVIPKVETVNPYQFEIIGIRI